MDNGKLNNEKDESEKRMIQLLVKTRRIRNLKRSSRNAQERKIYYSYSGADKGKHGKLQLELKK